MNDERIEQLLTKKKWFLLGEEDRLMPMLHPPVTSVKATWTGSWTPYLFKGKKILVPHYAEIGFGNAR